MLECFDDYCPFHASYNTDKQVFQCNRDRCIDDEDQGFRGDTPTMFERESFEE